MQSLRISKLVLLLLLTPCFAQTRTNVDLANQVKGNLAPSHLNGGTNANSGTCWFGDATWKTCGGGGTPGGSNGNLQYNNSGVFGGFADGTSTQVLHGGRTFGSVNLATDVSGQLPIGSVGSAGLSASSPITINSAGAITCATCGITSNPLSQFSTNGQLTIAPSATGLVPVTFNCPSGISVDCFDVNINGVKQFFVDLNGKTNLQPSTTTSASFNISTASAALPSTPVAGDVALVGNQLTYYDSSASQQNVAANNITTQFVQAQSIVSPNSSTIPFYLKLATSPTAHAFDIQDSTGAVQFSIAGDFGATAPYYKTNGTTNGLEEFTATGVDPQTLYAVSANSVRFEAPNTITNKFRVLWPAAPGTNGQALITNACPNDADGVPLCTLSFGAGGGGSGSVTSIATTSPITGGTITTTGTIGCGTCGVTGTGLNQFATTTSAQLAGVISDETGTGVLVFANTPTLVTPVIGAATGTSLAATSFLSTGTAPSCTVGTGGTLCQGEGTAPTAAATVDILYADSTLHGFKAKLNNTNAHIVPIIELGSCAMSAATTCTFSASASFSGTPLTFSSIDAASTVPATANSSKCAISGTTVTITAGISNSLTWDCLLVGNPN